MKQLLLEECNAIGTAGLRAELLPQAQRIQARMLGRQELTTAIDRTKSIQSSLDEMIDLGEKRLTP